MFFLISFFFGIVVFGIVWQLVWYVFLVAKITSRVLLLCIQIRFFDLRLIFLLTAQRVDLRKQLAQEHHGISLLGN